MALRAPCTLLSEGCRGHLGKQAIQAFQLDQHAVSQHYALGFKEIWRVQSTDYPLGRVVHTLGYLCDIGLIISGYTMNLGRFLSSFRTQSR